MFPKHYGHLKFKSKIMVEKEEERRDRENWAGKMASLPSPPQVILVCGLFGSHCLQKRCCKIGNQDGKSITTPKSVGILKPHFAFWNIWIHSSQGKYSICMGQTPVANSLWLWFQMVRWMFCSFYKFHDMVLVKAISIWSVKLMLLL